MLAQITGGLDFQSKALVLRAERQRTIASNIANADTPGYAARDFDFKSALQNATRSGDSFNSSTGQKIAALQPAGSTTHAQHFSLQATAGSTNSLAYTVQAQPSMDGNSVDLDRERANFVDNAVRYEATLRFINGHSKTMLSAIQGQ